MKRARATDMARFVIHLRMTPTEYYALTLAEHDAILAEWNSSQKRR